MSQFNFLSGVSSGRKGAPFSSIMDMSGDEFKVVESKRSQFDRRGAKRQRTGVYTGTTAGNFDQLGLLVGLGGGGGGSGPHYDLDDQADNSDGLGSLEAISGSARKWVVPRYEKQLPLDVIHSMGLPRELRRQMQIPGRDVVESLQRQSHVVCTLRGMKNQYEMIVKRVPEAYQLVPVGDPEDFKFAPHMIWLIPLSSVYKPSRAIGGDIVPQLHTGIVSTVLVNGLDTREQYAVGGLTQTFRDQNNKGSDDLSTGVIRGLESTRHTGSGRFTPGVKIGVSFTPNIMYTGNKGRAVPMIKYDSLSDTAMLPQTYPLNMMSACEQPARIRGRIDTVIRAAIQAAKDRKAAGAAAALVSAKTLFEDIGAAIATYRKEFRMNDISDRLPIITYGYWYALEKSWSRPLDGFMMSSIAHVQEACGSMLAMLSTALKESDSNMYIAQRNQYLPGVVDQAGRDEVQRFASLLSAWQANVTVDDLDAATEDIMNFQAYCRSMQDHTITAQVDYNQNHTLGRALNVCDPGQQVDVDLRPGV